MPRLKSTDSNSPKRGFSGDPSSLPYVLTVKQAAEVMGMKKSSVYELVAQNKIPHVRFGDRRIRIQRDALLQWLGAPPVGTAPVDARKSEGSGELRDAVLAAILLKLTEVEASLAAIRAMLRDVGDPSSDWSSLTRTNIRMDDKTPRIDEYGGWRK